MNNIWINGVPTIPGIYWFDAGFRHFEDRSDPLILQITNNSSYVFGSGGSCMPLSMVYTPGSNKKASWAHIEQATKWDASKCLIKRSKAWIKHPKGYIGVALCHYIDCGVRADVIWLDHPQNASGHGMFFNDKEGYLYCPIDVPKTRKLK